MASALQQHFTRSKILVDAKFTHLMSCRDLLDVLRPAAGDEATSQELAVHCETADVCAGAFSVL